MSSANGAPSALAMTTAIRSMSRGGPPPQQPTTMTKKKNDRRTQTRKTRRIGRGLIAMVQGVVMAALTI
jgi:hypothetical protein